MLFTGLSLGPVRVPVPAEAACQNEDVALQYGANPQTPTSSNTAPASLALGPYTSQLQTPTCHMSLHTLFGTEKGGKAMIAFLEETKVCFKPRNEPHDQDDHGSSAFTGTRVPAPTALLYL